jgi:hypothetical protein
MWNSTFFFTILLKLRTQEIANTYIHTHLSIYIFLSSYQSSIYLLSVYLSSSLSIYLVWDRVLLAGLELTILLPQSASGMVVSYTFNPVLPKDNNLYNYSTICNQEMDIDTSTQVMIASAYVCILFNFITHWFSLPPAKSISRMFHNHVALLCYPFKAINPPSSPTIIFIFKEYYLKEII